MFSFLFFYLPSSTCRGISWVLLSIISYCLITLSKLQTHSLNARGLCPILFLLPHSVKPRTAPLMLFDTSATNFLLLTCFQLFSPPSTCVVKRSQRGYIRVQTITFRSQPEDFCCGCCCSLCLLCLPASRCSASSYFFYL